MGGYAVIFCCDVLHIMYYYIGKGSFDNGYFDKFDNGFLNKYEKQFIDMFFYL
jgi:hypothetical protein